ncbi:MAG: hypothetical protein V4547_09050 [Bacteroidota bacterium]
MSIEDSKNIPLRELIRHNITIMEEHKRDSDLFRNKASRMLTEIEIHNVYSKELLAAHDKDIKKLNSAKDVQTGFLAALSAVGLTFIIDLFKRMSH